MEIIIALAIVLASIAIAFCIVKITNDNDDLLF